jgi:K+-transporting ATPase ATPase B chain
MIAMVEGASRQKTPNEIALTLLLSALTMIFLLVIMTLKPFGLYAKVAFSFTTLIALLVCLIPTTIGGLLSAIGIAGMDRLLQRNVLATSGRAVEAAGDIDVLLLDKTGTITLGNRQASDFVPAPGVTASGSPTRRNCRRSPMRRRKAAASWFSRRRNSIFGDARWRQRMRSSFPSPPKPA